MTDAGGPSLHRRLVYIDLEVASQASNGLSWSNHAVAFLMQTSTRLALNPVTVTNLSDVTTALQSNDDGPVVGVVVRANPKAQALVAVLRSGLNMLGPLPHLFAVILPYVNGEVASRCFEAGVETFWLPNSTSDHMREYFARLTHQDQTEQLIMALSRAVRLARPDGIVKTLRPIEQSASWDYRAAVAAARGREALGEYAAAQALYRSAVELEPMFRPARMALAENYLITGDFERAHGLLVQLDREFPADVDRKSALASVFLEKKDFETARQFAAAASALDPNHTRTIEALAQIHIETKEYAQALELIERMREVGPYFAAKLNEVGIQLSQTGDLQTAYRLYETAHKVVRPELRYKITMNSALALRKMNDFRGALALVERCSNEYGGMFPKLEKLKAVLLEEQKVAS